MFTIPGNAISNTWKVYNKNVHDYLKPVWVFWESCTIHLKNPRLFKRDNLTSPENPETPALTTTRYNKTPSPGAWYGAISCY